jgi:hypothetical protein
MTYILIAAASLAVIMPLLVREWARFDKIGPSCWETVGK